MDALNPGTPDTSAMAQNQPAPTPAPTQPPVTPGDMGSVSGAVGAVQQAAQPQPQPPQPQPDNGVAPKQSWWKTLLTGALDGLAGAGRSGARSFGGGLGAGAAGELQQQQQNIVNQRQAAITQSDIRFKDLQSATAAANLHAMDQMMHQRDEDFQMKREEFAQNSAKFMQDNFGVSYTPISNTNDAVQKYLSQATANGVANGDAGAHVPSGTIIGSKTIFVPNQDDVSGPLKDYNFLSTMGGMLGIPTPSRAQFMAAPPNARRMMLEPVQWMMSGHDRNGAVLKDETLDNQINYLTTSLAQYQKQPGFNPAAVEQGQRTLDLLKSQQVSEQAYKDKEFARQMQLMQARGSSFLGSRIIKVDNGDGTVGYMTGTGQPIAPGRTESGGKMFSGLLSDGTVVKGSAPELRAAGASTITSVGQSDTDKTNISRQLIAPNGLFSMVKNDIAQLGDNQFGPIASRWNEFESGKVGVGPQFAALRTHMGLLSTALMQAHLGSRGGEQAIEHFADLANYKISDAATLRSALAAEWEYANEKAAMIPKTLPKAGK